LSFSLAIETSICKVTLKVSTCKVEDYVDKMRSTKNNTQTSGWAAKSATGANATLLQTSRTIYINGTPR